MSKDTYMGACSRILNGRSACIINLLCCPFVMFYQSANIYCLGCLVEDTVRLANTVCCFACKLCCWWCCEYKDKRFPATSASIGEWKGKSAAEIDKEIEWKRATVVVDELGPQPKAGEKQPRVKLFEAGISITDVAQGGLGDCWLISALCCMAERPGQLYKVFVNTAYSDRGKYSVRLYDGRAGKWTVVTVDDLLPVEKASGR